MGFWDRVLGQPTTGLGQPRERMDARTVEFAAQRIDPTVRPDRRRLARSAKRSDEMWAAYENVGEVGYIVDFFGNALRRIRVFPAGIDDPKDGRIPLAECDWANPKLASDATELLDRVRSVEHGQGEVLAGIAQNLKVAGAGNLYARPSEDFPQLEDWEVLSTSALVYHRGKWCRKRYPDEKNPEPIPDPRMVWQFWQRHPRWPGLAYSEMGRILGHAEDLQLLEKASRNRSRSRVAGPGVLFMSNRSAFKPHGPEGINFFDQFLKHMTVPITEEGSVSGFAPLLVDVDADDVRASVLHQTFDNPLTQLEVDREDSLIRRIGQGMDAPPELATGYHDVKFANGMIIQQETYEAHIEPLALRVADVLAVAVVRSGLIALGHPPELVARVLNGVDPADLVRRTNTPQDAKDAHKARVISDQALRERLDFDDGDAPDEEELARRVDADRTTRSGPDTSSTDTQATAVPSPALAASASSTVSSLGGKLHDLDQVLTATVLAAATVAVDHVLNRAAARVHQAVRRTADAALARGPARGIVGRLQHHTLDLEDLVVDEDFTGLRDTYQTAATQTYTSAAAATGKALDGPVDTGDHQDDIDAGWAVLLAGLVASTRLAIAAPAVDPDPGQLGETDPGAIVQPSLVRSSLSRAGGALGATTDGGAVLVDGGTRPAGAIATGENILDAATQAGLVLTGWTWRTGAPAQIFPAHHDLDGVQYTGPNDPKLANETGEWPGNGHWYPGDHKGCRCTSEPALTLPSSN